MKLERNLNNLENNLTYYAKYCPIIPGAIQFAVGTVQAVVGFGICFIGLYTFAPLWRPSMLDFGWTHLKHGLGNMVAGTLGSIPGFNALFRSHGTIKWNVSDDGKIESIHPNVPKKFMQYKELNKHDCSNVISMIIDKRAVTLIFANGDIIQSHITSKQCKKLKKTFSAKIIHQKEKYSKNEFGSIFSFAKKPQQIIDNHFTDEIDFLNPRIIVKRL